MAVVDSAVDRWWAACELIRARDAMHVATAAGCATRVDLERLRDADVRWTAARSAAGR